MREQTSDEFADEMSRAFGRDWWLCGNVPLLLSHQVYDAGESIARREAFIDAAIIATGALPDVPPTSVCAECGCEQDDEGGQHYETCSDYMWVTP